jgi:hypothetical protein
MTKPETLDEYKVLLPKLLALLLECRDALPAISLVSAKLHNIDLTLAVRIESVLEPWIVP